MEKKNLFYEAPQVEIVEIMTEGAVFAASGEGGNEGLGGVPGEF